MSTQGLTGLTNSHGAVAVSPQSAKTVPPGAKAQFAQAMQAAQSPSSSTARSVQATPYQPQPPRAGTAVPFVSSMNSEMPKAAASDKIGTYADTLMASGYRKQNNFWVVKMGAATIPDQGWKIHISPARSEDTVKLAKSLFPKLSEAGVTHKIVHNNEGAAIMGGDHKGTSGSSTHLATGGTQHGKMITMYASSEKEAAQLAALARDHINKTGITDFLAVPNDQKISPGVSGRYGINQANVNQLINPETGVAESDNRKKAKPDWVKDLVVPEKYNAHRAGHAAGPGTLPEPTGEKRFEKSVSNLGKAEGFSIGRSTGADLESTAPTVSSKHARVYRGTDGATHIADLGSTNGTTIVRDGQSIAVKPGTPQKLQSGDTIKVGGEGGETYKMPGSTTAFTHRLSELTNATGFSIGRDPAKSDIVSAGAGTSGQHARVFRDVNGALKVADLGSTNGTTVERNGTTLPVTKGTPVSLNPGDKIVVSGETYTIPGGTKAAVTAMPGQAQQGALRTSKSAASVPWSSRGAALAASVKAGTALISGALRR